MPQERVKLSEVTDVAWLRETCEFLWSLLDAIADAESEPRFEHADLVQALAVAHDKAAERHLSVTPDSDGQELYAVTAPEPSNDAPEGSTLSWGTLVKVRLNDRGRAFHGELRLRKPAAVTALKEDREGYSLWPLWFFMKMFGPHVETRYFDRAEFVVGPPT